jgi:hypothetical protein
MKLSHFLALLKNELRTAWPIFLVGPFYAYLNIFIYRNYHFYDLNPVTSGSFIVFFMPFMAFNILFQSESYGFRAPGNLVLGRLEFMFTRAISRVELFGSKSSIYLIVSFLPLLSMVAHSYTAPSLKVQLPYSVRDHREEAKQFYLSHFKDAYLQEPDAGTNKDYVVFPTGRINQSVCALLLGVVVTLFFQVMLFTFSGRRWLPTALLILLAFLLPFGSFAHITPSFYEYLAAWVAQQPALAFLTTGLLVALAELYCCRRFVQTEITS